jgi:hypothetical protein
MQDDPLETGAHMAFPALRELNGAPNAIPWLGGIGPALGIPPSWARRRHSNVVLPSPKINIRQRLAVIQL